MAKNAKKNDEQKKMEDELRGLKFTGLDFANAMTECIEIGMLDIQDTKNLAILFSIVRLKQSAKKSKK